MLTVDFERLGLEPGTRVLDLGCGDGRHIRQARRYPGVTAVALDLGKKEAHAAARSLQEMDEVGFAFGGADAGSGPWISMRGSTYDLPFADGAFDCVILSEVLEHLHEDRRALDEVSRVLRGGGLLAVSVPRTGPEAICWALSHQYRNSPGGHVRIYLRSVLRRLLAESGYRIVGSHFAHALHSPYWWLKCAIGLDNDRAWPVDLYHRLLVWDLMQKPLLTRAIETCLNPFIGKSVVFYAVKGPHS